MGLTVVWQVPPWQLTPCTLWRRATGVAAPHAGVDEVEDVDGRSDRRDGEERRVVEQ